MNVPQIIDTKRKTVNLQRTNFVDTTLTEWQKSRSLEIVLSNGTENFMLPAVKH